LVRLETGIPLALTYLVRKEKKTQQKKRKELPIFT